MLTCRSRTRTWGQQPLWLAPEQHVSAVLMVVEKLDYISDESSDEAEKCKLAYVLQDQVERMSCAVHPCDVGVPANKHLASMVQKSTVQCSRIVRASQ